MKLTRHERRALNDWMNAKGLSRAGAAKILKVSAHAITKWFHGGGVSHKIAARLRIYIDPFLHNLYPAQLDSDFKFTHEKLQKALSARPHEVKFYSNHLTQIEAFLKNPEEATIPVIPTAITPVASQTEIPDVSLRQSAAPVTEFPTLACRLRVGLIPLPELASPSAPTLPKQGPRNPKPPQNLHEVTDFIMNDDSMEPNFAEGEELQIIPFPGGPIIYSHLNDTAATVRRAYSEIGAGIVVAVCINGGELTCKRLIFRFKGMNREIWFTADCPQTPGFPHCVQGQDSVIILGVVKRQSEEEPKEIQDPSHS
jgi:hypothetical protein